MSHPDEIHAQCVKYLKDLFSRLESGELRVTELEHEVGIEPYAGEYAVSNMPEYSGKEWIRLSFERRQDEKI